MYAYDNAGNITSKREYAYTTGTPGSVLSTITYTYGDSAWGDLLTAYNGNAISYDTIGNPLSDGTWTYTWEHGRELASMYAEDTDGTDNEVTVSYTYNADGLRIRKTVTTKTYEAVQHTVTFVADGTTVKTMTVNDGYTLTASDYPAVPPKSGYTGSWPEHSSPITANTTITAVYTANPTYTVTFVADGVTVKTMTVNDGYTLTASDYPAVPPKSGYTGSWPEHSSPITANTTITAVYTPIPTEPSEPPAATHTVTFRVTYSASYGYTVKTMTVEDGYVLTASDYPTTYGVTWQQYTSPITSDVTVNGTYSWGGYGAADEAEATGEIAAEAAAESTAVSRTGSTTLVKTVTETYDYVYNGDRLSQVKKTTSTTTSSGTTNATDTLNFTYDANGTPMAVKHNNTNYYYVTNLQGDVTAILNTSGTAVASYTYDAWGNILTTGGSMASTLGTLNPLRYRGYVYDTETGLYYLRSRYYNPVMGRFINSDDPANLGADEGLNSFNLFAYCTNNPVNRFDENGNWSLPNWAKVAIGVGIIAAAAVVTVATGGAAVGPLVAAVHCAAQGALVGAVTQSAIGAVTGGISSAVMHRMTTGSWSGAANAAIDGAASGFMTGAITGAISGAISSPYCFVAGTTVLTAAGVAAIETIHKGDVVWAWDEETGDVALKEVVETYVNETDELVHVFVNGEEIVATPAHPFYSPVKGWTEAVHLRAGDILVLVNGEYVVVEKVQHEILESPVKVYNFQVADYHTYYVANGVLVHNTCHGNSLKSPKKTDLYVLRDNATGTVKKIGETTRGIARYTKKFYSQNNVHMQIIDSGSKHAMHYQQHRILAQYFDRVGQLPSLNKSFW